MMRRRVPQIILSQFDAPDIVPQAGAPGSGGRQTPVRFDTRCNNLDTSRLADKNQ